MIPLTLAEIRRLIILAAPKIGAIVDDTLHALHWSKWRRAHQTHARRAHFRRRLRLQTLRT